MKTPITMIAPLSSRLRDAGASSRTSSKMAREGIAALITWDLDS